MTRLGPEQFRDRLTELLQRAAIGDPLPILEKGIEDLILELTPMEKRYCPSCAEDRQQIVLDIIYIRDINVSPPVDVRATLYQCGTCAYTHCFYSR